MHATYLSQPYRFAPALFTQKLSRNHQSTRFVPFTQLYVMPVLAVFSIGYTSWTVYFFVGVVFLETFVHGVSVIAAV